MNKTNQENQKNNSFNKHYIIEKQDYYFYDSCNDTNDYFELL